MRTILRLTVLALVLAGCSGKPMASVPTCFERRPVSKQLSAGETRALEDSRRRSAEKCSRNNSQCGFGVSTRPNGEIGVMVQFASVSESGECVYIASGYHIDMYDKIGDFEETIPDLHSDNERLRWPN